jgi:hypothetical protein
MVFLDQQYAGIPGLADKIRQQLQLAAVFQVVVDDDRDPFAAVLSGLVDFRSARGEVR